MELNLNTIKNVHFIGIGGIGISAIARMMISLGKNVTGQDMQDGEIVEELRKLGVDVKIGQSFENIPTNTEFVVYTIAIEYYDPELFKKLKFTKARPLQRQDLCWVKSYPEMLGIVSKDKYTIAVSGTHGKTTTTGMIAKVLENKNPTVVIGSLIKNQDGSRSNFITGDGDVFVVEACEYRRSFLNINPQILVITNIDEDHLDYYKDIEDIKSAFRELAMKVPESGYVVCNPNDKNIADVVKDIKAKIVNWKEFFNQDLKLKIPGLHNKKDGACALAVANILEVSKTEAENSLSEFPGIWRRFEYRGKVAGGALLYDDYAHHPVEITSTLEGFRELYPSVAGPEQSRGAGYKITVVFQPHLFSRTKLLLNDFAKSFGDADQVLILPIYYAREEDDGSISSEILAQKINHAEGRAGEISHNAKAFPDFDLAEVYLKEYLHLEAPNIDKNVVITMGAGEAFKVGDYLLGK
jgi:UDP-N-acetylmuramate--alanine ligase